MAALTLSGNAFARGSSLGGHTSYKSSYSYGSRSDHAIGGCTRSNGSYVKPSRATNPYVARNNNYSTEQSLSPYTVKFGIKHRDDK